MSLPVRGAWIEIVYFSVLRVSNTSLPVRGAWIEMLNDPDLRRMYESLPVRGAWIEIGHDPLSELFSSVAPRAGSVD